VQIASRVRLEARPREAPVSQVSSPRTGPFEYRCHDTKQGCNREQITSSFTPSSRRPKATDSTSCCSDCSPHPSQRSLITAVMESDISKVCEILNDQRKVVWLDDKSIDRAIFIGSGQGQEQVVRLLLEKGADVNGRRGSNYIMHCTSKTGIEQVLMFEKALMSCADSRYTCTALQYALANRHKAGCPATAREWR
jgi:hypothetical protein